MTLTEHQKEFMERIEKEFKNAFKMMNDVSDRQKVTVYGSARVTEDNPMWQEVMKISTMLRTDGWMVITGGGPGFMQAALKKDMTPDWETLAFRIDINGERNQSKADLAIDFTDFFVRKYFLRISDVFIVAPGGFGTLDEAFELMTLIQTRKMKNKKVIFFKKDYWQPLLDWFQSTLLEQGMISAEDLDIIHLVDTPEEVVALVNKSA